MIKRIQLFLLVFLIPLVALSEEKAEESEADEGHSLAHSVVFYLPNRVLDILDIFRFRALVGPGGAVGVRVTEPLSAFLGSYSVAYAGLPGPRLDDIINYPVGIEARAGAAVSVVELDAYAGTANRYSPTEIGFNLHALLLGFDFGFDPVEVVDFGVGIFGFDIRDDDL